MSRRAAPLATLTHTLPLLRSSRARRTQVVHPDIVADFGAAYADERVLLARITELTTGKCWRHDANPDDHWSLHPYAKPVGGKMIHKHHGGPDEPDKWCKARTAATPPPAPATPSSAPLLPATPRGRAVRRAPAPPPARRRRRAARTATRSRRPPSRT